MTESTQTKTQGRPKKTALEIAAKELSDSRTAYLEAKAAIDFELDLDNCETKEESESILNLFNARTKLAVEVDNLSTKIRALKAELKAISNKKSAKAFDVKAKIKALTEKKEGLSEDLADLPPVGMSLDDWDEFQEAQKELKRKPGKSPLPIELVFYRAKQRLGAAQKEYRKEEKAAGIPPRNFEEVIKEELSNRKLSGGPARKLDNLGKLDKDLLLLLRKQEEIVHAINNPVDEPERANKQGRKKTPLSQKLKKVESQIKETKEAIARAEAAMDPLKLIDVQIRRIQVAQRILRKKAKDIGYADISDLPKSHEIAIEFNKSESNILDLKRAKLDYEVEAKSSDAKSNLMNKIQGIKVTYEEKKII